MPSPTEHAVLAQVLAWRAPADPGGALRGRARVSLLHQIEALFARAAPPEEGARFRALFAALPPASRRRLLDAPSLWGQVLLDLDSDVTPFLEAACAEHLRLGRAVAGAGPCWTALGDASFPAGAPGSAVRPPRLPQGAVLDAWSPHATARVPGVVERFEPHTPAELRRILTGLHVAGRALPDLCPEASALVRRFAKTVLLRRDPDAPNQYLSESTEGVLGRVLLCNAHLPQVSALDLLESLVHESVHSYLSTVELFCPLLADRARMEERALVSPWTGNRLDAQRFVHAALVWYALAHLWRRALAVSSPWGQSQVTPRLERALAGLSELPALLPALAPALTPSATTLLAGLTLAR